MPGASSVTIANGAQDSSVFQLGEATYMALGMPAAFTGTAMTFKGASTEAGTFVVVKDDSGSDVSITVGTSRWVALQAAVMAKLAAFRFLKLVSGSAEGAARTIEIVSK
jgi:hypothetical protein